MKITVAAAAPEMLPGQPGRNMANVQASIARARDDGAAILVLPAGLPADMDWQTLEREADKMVVYPLMQQSLTREELMLPREGKVLCCSTDSPATISSHYENINLAGLSSHEHMCVVVMACPMGGDGGTLYTGQCIIAQNGAILQSEDGYAIAQVSIPSREKKAPVEGVVDQQPITPWTPFPEELPRILKLQGEGLARRMMARGATSLSVRVERTASSLLALIACVTAVDKLKLSRRNIHAQTDGERAGQIAAVLGVTVGGQGGLAVDDTDLTRRAIDGVQPEQYDVNAMIPRSVARLAMRHWANTCGDSRLSVPIRSIVNHDNDPWEMYDYLLYFSMLYELPKWTQARMLQDAFAGRYNEAVINQVLDRFFDHYHRPAACDGPAVFSADPIREER